MKKATILAMLVLSMASCSKTENDYKCYTCRTQAGSPYYEDFCGTEKELNKYIEFKATKGQAMKCQ